MRLSCFQENLSKGLSIVGRAVSSRSTLPVLGNILLEAKDNQLRLAATNLEIGINCWVGASVDVEGAITVPSRLLAEFVNSLPPGKIDMELLVSKQTLRLRSANYDVNIKGIDAQEFPVIPTVDSGEGPEETAEALEGRTVALETAGLTKMIDQVVFAAATDESRPTLTGVEVTFAAGAALPGSHRRLPPQRAQHRGWGGFQRRYVGRGTGATPGRIGSDRRRL